MSLILPSRYADEFLVIVFESLELKALALLSCGLYSILKSSENLRTTQRPRTMPYMFRKRRNGDGVYMLMSKECLSGEKLAQFVNAETDHEVKPHVKELQLSRAYTWDLSDVDIRNISDGLVNLDRLVVESLIEVTEEGCESLFANINQLRAIVIGENQFTDATFASLAKHCRNLEDVTIHDHSSMRPAAIEPFIKFETPLVSLKIIGGFYLSSPTIVALLRKCKTLKTFHYTGMVCASMFKAICNSNVRNLSIYKSHVDKSVNLVLPKGRDLQITYIECKKKKKREELQSSASDED